MMNESAGQNAPQNPQSPDPVSGDLLAQLRSPQQESPVYPQILYNVFDNVGHLVMLLDRRGRIMQANRIMEELVGVQHGELVQRSFGDLLLLQEEVDEFAAVLSKLQIGWRPGRFQHIWLTHGRQRRIVIWQFTSFMSPFGAADQFLASGLDAPVHSPRQGARRNPL